MPARKVITIDVESVGELKLKFANMLLIEFMIKSEIGDREFFTQLFKFILIEPNNLKDKIDELSDGVLNRIIYQWAIANDIEVRAESQTSLSSLRTDLKVSASKTITEIMQPFLESIDRINKQTLDMFMVDWKPAFDFTKPIASLDIFSSLPTITNFTQPLTSLAPFDTSFTNSLISDFVSSIPNTWEILGENFQKILEEGRKSNEALDELGLGFAIDHMIDVLGFELLAQLPDAHLVATDEVIQDFDEVVKSEDFYNPFVKPFHELKELEKRRQIIELGYQLHKDGMYIASIPVLLPQIEFLMRTLLVLRENIAIKNNKVYVLENGEIKIDDDGDEVQINGLGELLKNSTLDEDDLLNKLANIMTGKVVSARNDILHGTSYKYGKVKLSLQCILIVLVLSHTIYNIEQISHDT